MALERKFAENGAPTRNHEGVAEGGCGSVGAEDGVEGVIAPADAIEDLIWSRDFREYVTTTRSEFDGVDATPDMLENTPRIRHARGTARAAAAAPDRRSTPNNDVVKNESSQNNSNSSNDNNKNNNNETSSCSSGGAGSSSSSRNNLGGQRREPTAESPERRFYQNVWRMLKNAYGRFTTPRLSHQVSILESAPQNTVSNLVKMIFLPVLLVVIVMMMIPSIKELAFQTYQAIFYNTKLPDTRIASLKRVSVGISLVFDHMVKKLFPVVRLRWMNRKLFKRREPVLANVPPSAAVPHPQA